MGGGCPPGDNAPGTVPPQVTNQRFYVPLQAASRRPGDHRGGATQILYWRERSSYVGETPRIVTRVPTLAKFQKYSASLSVSLTQP